MTGIVIIPAYNPEKRLRELVDEMCEQGYEVVVVNDGSDDTCDEIFDEISEVAVVLTHEHNRGKGAAIKTALQYINENFETEDIVVGTMDADGQHNPMDVANVMAYALTTKGEALVLGVRKVGKKMPFPSRAANEITRVVYCMNTGVWVSDTQTGLRAFGGKLIPFMLQVKGERYEYEMNVLLQAAKKKITIREVPIRTIYHDEKNTCSHFRKGADSLLIYKDILKFSAVSITSFVLDYVLFVLFHLLFAGIAGNIVFSNIIARILSAAYNYYMNTTRVFHKKRSATSTIEYMALAGGILVGNTILLTLYMRFGISQYIAKIMTELTLFIISFVIQRFVIFRKETIQS